MDKALLVVGTLAEPGVLEAIVGHPLDIKPVTISNWGIRFQPWKKIPEKIKEKLRISWGEGFYGGFCLVHSPGQDTEAVACIIKEEDWASFTARLRYWNYWKGEDKDEDEGWFELKKVGVRNGVEYFTESLPLETLERPPKDFEYDQRYLEFVVKMIEIAKEDRSTLEGQSGGPIESRPH